MGRLVCTASCGSLPAAWAAHAAVCLKGCQQSGGRAWQARVLAGPEPQTGQRCLTNSPCSTCPERRRPGQPGWGHNITTRFENSRLRPTASGSTRTVTHVQGFGCQGGPVCAGRRRRDQAALTVQHSLRRAAAQPARCTAWGAWWTQQSMIPGDWRRHDGQYCRASQQASRQC